MAKNPSSTSILGVCICIITIYYSNYCSSMNCVIAVACVDIGALLFEYTVAEKLGEPPINSDFCTPQSLPLVELELVPKK